MLPQLKVSLKSANIILDLTDSIESSSPQAVKIWSKSANQWIEISDLDEVSVDFSNGTPQIHITIIPAGEVDISMEVGDGSSDSVN